MRTLVLLGAVLLVGACSTTEVSDGQLPQVEYKGTDPTAETQPEYVAYLAEGWDALPPGKVAQVTHATPGDLYRSPSGHEYVPCIIDYRVLNYKGDVPVDAEGDPQVLLDGDFMYVTDVEESFGGKGCRKLF